MEQNAQSVERDLESKQLESKQGAQVDAAEKDGSDRISDEQLEAAVGGVSEPSGRLKITNNRTVDRPAGVESADSVGSA